jgi:hypothetical protein
MEDADMYDEFGNYVGPDLDDSSDSVEEQQEETVSIDKLLIVGVLGKICVTGRHGCR